ncbi:hypothetical protein HY501_00440 [Candidatus Woesearchaeota archaeon]|nr:hypothetical protein [Candidatus Woesearchaeota archaeon]
MPGKVMKDFFEEYIGGRVVKHDRYQFEVKLNYNLDQKQKINKYKVSMYMFIPKALDIMAETYTKQQFFHDIKSFIRFQSPKISLNKLMDHSNPLSPLYQLNIHLESRDKEKIIHELKLLACIIKSNIVDEVYKLNADPGKSKKIQWLLKEIDLMRAAVSELRNKITAEGYADEVKTAFYFADEYISIILESNLTNILDQNKLARAEEKEILKRINYEQEYRRTISYTASQSEREDERALYHFGILKKYISNVLFLEVKDTKADEKMGHVTGAIAAGIAMIVAGVIAWVSQATFKLYSMPFLLLLIGGYVLKDRIKDWSKLYFSKKLNRIFPDKSFRIHDPSFNNFIGSAKESMSFVREKDIPVEIEEIRNKEHKSKIEEEGRPENIINYEKLIELETKKITAMHKRVKDLSDIIRFNVIDFLRKADEPYVNMVLVQENKLLRKDFSKVYHLNVVFKLNYNLPSGEEVSQYKRIRVILDQLGIKRIEEVR